MVKGMTEEKAKVVVREEAVLEKFDGEPEDGLVRERITLVNGEIVKHEFFDESGNPIDSEGGNDATN